MLDTYFRNLLYVVHAGNSFFELVCIFILQKLKICMLFKGGVGWGMGSSSNQPKFIKIYLFYLYCISDLSRGFLGIPLPAQQVVRERL